MPKRTYQPKKRKRAKTHGFLSRTKSPGGKRVIARRRQKAAQSLPFKRMIPRRLRLTRRAFPSPSTGMRATSAHFLLTWGPAAEGGVSAIVSKKTARRSVDRHLLKRRMLSVLRPYCRPDYFFVLYARAGSLSLPFQELKAELLELLMKTNGRINHS